jgi:glycerophosphoryl diester phosphodiesterase
MSRSLTLHRLPPCAVASLLAVVLAAGCTRAARRSTAPGETRSPLVIAHRGASGHLPEHTLASYRLAIEMGADFIEPDLVPTKDGVLVARHENEIGATTDVASRFPDRKTTKIIDGVGVSGWFTEDFTLSELKTLRARERLSFRSHAHDGEEPIPTLSQVLELVDAESRRRGRRIGVYPETKHPAYFQSIGLPLEDALLAELARRGWSSREAPVFIQSFEVANLKALRRRTQLKLVQLIAATGAPYAAIRSSGDPTSYASMLTPDGLRAVAQYADGIGVEKSLVQPADAQGALGPPTTLVADAHRAGLAVHVWTLRSDSTFLPAGYRGDARAEWKRFAALGVDGIFGDFPDVGVAALGVHGGGAAR